MTLALTLLFAFNLARRLQRCDAARRQVVQIDRVRKDFVNSFSSQTVGARRLVTKQSHCCLNHLAPAAKMPRSFSGALLTIRNKK
jgi:hypothetical protein